MTAKNPWSFATQYLLPYAPCRVATHALSQAVTTAALRLLPLALCLLLSALCLLPSVAAQSATATLSGTVLDERDAVIPGATVAVVNTSTGARRQTATNEQGDFIVPLLPPSTYVVNVQQQGFAPVEVQNVILNVGDQKSLQIHLKAGNISEIVQVNADAPLINESPAVGTVVDRQFVANLPLNGRSFQSLMTLSPGVVLTKAGQLSGPGQFSVNGQRADANYFSIDGVSANIAVPTNGTPGQAAGGSLPGFSASGGTNNLVSIDALQEFKLETSSYAPEFGRTPGGQVLIATRSGTNDFHGTLFEFFRNDALDATDWFVNANPILKKAALRQNQFGGVLGGPILFPRFGEGGRHLYNGRNKTFFFFSYEGLRLRQPLFTSTDVPSLAARQAAPPAIQPFLNAFPLPNGPAGANNLAPFLASYSNPSSFDATSIRIDHNMNDKFSVFGRYNYSPSEALQRSSSSDSLNSVGALKIKTQTLTLGGTFIFSPRVNNELRVNYSRNSGHTFFTLDSFGGAVVPAESVLFASVGSSRDSILTLTIGGTRGALNVGNTQDSVQRQFNLVDNVSLVSGSHQLKTGVDYRRAFPIIGPQVYGQNVFFAGVAGALTGRASSVSVSSQAGPLFPVFTNLSFYFQDTWKTTRRLTLTYGLRYEINPPPTEANGKNPSQLNQIDNPATFALAPSGTRPYKTTYNNFAPRIGAAFRLFQKPGRETLLRGGFGVFYDLGSNVVGNSFLASFPFLAGKSLSNVLFPLSSADAAPPSLPPNPPILRMFAYDSNLKLPYTLQWNFAVEQSLGTNQTISATYVAAVGRRLLRQEQLGSTIFTVAANPLFNATSRVFITRNVATSDYHALQLRFQRRLSRRLEALASYTWSHSIDIGSNDAFQVVPGVVADPKIDRGPSDFDIRHQFTAAVSYNLPAPSSKLGKSILGNWAIDTIVTSRSATPVDVTVLKNIGFGNTANVIRPDLVPNVPVYIIDSTLPGGRRFNPAAFFNPTAIRQGTLGRNALRGFPIFQTDLAVRRRFNLTERFNLLFKAEFFNVFNHPNFADPSGQLSILGIPQSAFGKSQSMFGRSLGSGGAIGGFNPLYQIGGPRSIQFSLKAQF